MTPPHLSIRDLHDGEGALAEPGNWVTVHLRATLVGDGSQLEETRTSGYGDRDYGKPVQFQLGDLSAHGVLRALHPVVLHMRVGGQRRVRTCVLDDNWGYREDHIPKLFVPRVVGERDSNRVPVARRKVQGDWLMDVVIDLEKVEKERPPTMVEAWIAQARAAVGR